MKLEVPRFDGNDALGWIFKISQFFDFHGTPPPERLTIASFYMDGAALSWFQWMTKNGMILTWQDFLIALETRFAPSFYDDPRGALFKLTQKGTVAQYLTEFERLANRIVGLPPPFLLSCFISGLSPEIRREVQAFSPMNLPQATALARIQEDKIDDRRRSFRPRPSSNNTSSQPTQNTPPTNNPPPSNPTSSPSPSKPKFRRLTQEEMASRRERGLCFNCDEHFGPSHRCKGTVFLFCADDDTDEPPEDTTVSDDPPPSTPVDSTPEAQLSMHAMSGSAPHETFRITGTIAKHQVAVLVDGGSTHNFVQERIAKYLGLPSSPVSSPLKVMVGNGETLVCSRRCSVTGLTIQGHHFDVDFYILPLRGAEVVLGVPWLQSLGPILMDYSKLTLQFSHLGQPITLNADITSQPNTLSLTQVKRCIQTQSIAQYYHIQLLPTPDPPSISPTPNSQTNTPPEILDLISQFLTLFNTPTELPPPRSYDHQIHLLPNTTPINVRPYRYPHFQKTEIEKQVSDMLSSGMIQPSRSPYSSPVLLVKKKDGSWRCCIDYRALNAVTVKDRFPMPTIDELLDELGGASWFSKLDLRQGFHQIRMHDDDVAKTAFRTHHGHYEFRVMPFGLCNAPSTFQAAMNDLLGPFLRKFVAVFFDDILVYSASLTDHLVHLETVFTKLVEGQFFLKQSKCLIGQRQLEYLGHIISAAGVQADQSKIQAMVDWPTPSSITSLRGFLGLTGFYRRFIRGYANIASPLTQLLRKDSFVWSNEAQLAFEALKRAMTEAPILVLPDFSIPFVLETDASGSAMGAVLLQRGHPIAFFSKPFCPRLMRSSTYVRELHAITTAVKKWRQYLLGHPFIIFTDHKSLKELITQVIQTPEQQVYLSKLLGYDFTIQYKSGKNNVVADALSRIDVSQGQLFVLTMPQFVFLDDLKLALQTNSVFQSLLADIEHEPTKFPSYKVSQGLIFFKGKIWIDASIPFKTKLLAEYHNSPVSGHMGVHKTLSRLQANFFWKGMRQDVQDFVAQCGVCQTTKYDTKRPAGLLQPLPIPSAIWEDLSLDFITGLPPSHGYSVILVVVDRFSKGVHFGALPAHFTAYKVATLFLDIICKYHGLPRSLVSDRDPIFISRFWRELFKLCGTKLRMSTAYHPETDGQTEVLNRVLEQYLRAFVHGHPAAWFKYLALAEWSYNTSVHSATGLSPYEVTYGKPPPSIPQYVLGNSDVAAVDSLLIDRQQMLKVLKRKLEKAQAQMKLYADKKRRDVDYNIGDWVYVKLRPYRQQSVSGHSYNKLSKRYYGPYRIIDRFGHTAYKLELPSSSKIHPVFHCSLLKPHVGPFTTVLDPLPPTAMDHNPIIEPLVLLDSKEDTSTNPPTTLVLVQWAGLPPEEATWEPWHILRDTYHLEDKVLAKGDGIVNKGAVMNNNEGADAVNKDLGKRVSHKPNYLKDFYT